MDPQVKTDLVHLGCPRVSNPRRLSAPADRLVPHSPGWMLALAVCPACTTPFVVHLPQRPASTRRPASADTGAPASPVVVDVEAEDPRVPLAARRTTQRAVTAGHAVRLLCGEGWLGLRVENKKAAWVALWTDGKRNGTWRLDGTHRHRVPAKELDQALKASS